MTLLGQNVNSFRDLSEVQFQSVAAPGLSRGFSTVYKAKPGGLRFSHLLDQVSRIDPEMRIRFTSPHPKDFPDEASSVRQLRNVRYGLCCLPKEDVGSPTGSSSSWDLDVGAKAGRFAVCWLLSREDFSLGTLVQLSCLRCLLITYHRSCSSSRSDTTSASSCTSQPRVGAHESWRP